MAYKIVMTVSGYPDIPQDEEVYRNLGADFVKIRCDTEEELIEAARDADVVIGVGQTYGTQVIEGLHKLRLISVISCDYEGVDLDAATKRGILVSNVPDYCLDEVSDHTLALLLACKSKLVGIHNTMKSMKFDSLETAWLPYDIMSNSTPLRNQTIGLIGLGRVGRTVVPKAKALGLRILVHDPYITLHTVRELAVETVDLERLLRESDYVSLHARITKENRKMLGSKQFQMMRPNAYLINTAHGELVDEEALLKALDQKLIAGAGLDVTDPEPMSPNSPLLKMDNVIFTGHTAWYSEKAIVDLRRKVEQNILALLRGKWPLGLLNPSAKEKYLQRFGDLSVEVTEK